MYALCVEIKGTESRENVFQICSHTSRVVEKIFVFVISRKFLRNFLRISRNFARHEIDILAKISQFRETRNKKNLGNILAFLQESDDFIIKNEKIRIFWDTMFITSKWILINFHLGQRKLVFLIF